MKPIIEQCINGNEWMSPYVLIHMNDNNDYEIISHTTKSAAFFSSISEAMDFVKKRNLTEYKFLYVAQLLGSITEVEIEVPQPPKMEKTVRCVLMSNPIGF